MNLRQEASFAPMEGRDDSPLPEPLDPINFKRLGRPVRRAVMRTRQWLLGRQHADGHWCAELEGDTILESETILLWAYLGREDSDLARRAADYLVEKQLPDGGWAMVPDGGVEISASVKAYFAMKLTGHDPGSEPMQRAKRAILAHGGADAVNSFTRFYLALLGQISYDQCPAVPPEMMFLPRWFPINLSRVSSWTRTIIVPLSIVSANRPVREVDPRFGIRELFLEAPEDWAPPRAPRLDQAAGLFSWDFFFRTVDRGLKWLERCKLMLLRGRAIKAAERWMLERFDRSDGLGAIFPPIVWSILALKSLGYDEDSPEFEESYRQLEDLVIDEEDVGRVGNPSTCSGTGYEPALQNSIRIQPCKSPVWDTAITVRAMAASGVQPDNPAMCKAIEWLLDRQITRPGDWSKTVKAEAGGWAFEYHNDFYPDVDDTAMVLMALQSQFADIGTEDRPPAALPPELRLMFDGAENDTELANLERTPQAIERGLNWLLAMQNKDGGWGAFDRNNNSEFLCHVPFADHNAMIDPSTADITARVLECLAVLGRRAGDGAVDRAVEFLRTVEEPDGSWFGRWGVNYIYGTWEVLTGLAAVGIATDDPMIQAGANWLRSCQQPCGGWGESAESYDDPALRGQGEPTASQTAWAVLGLLASGLHDHPAVARGINYLTDAQNDDGTWDEPQFTGTGFPRVFYLRYHYYPICFPLLALSEWAIQVDPLLAVEEKPQFRLVCG